MKIINEIATIFSFLEEYVEGRTTVGILSDIKAELEGLRSENRILQETVDKLIKERIIDEN